MTNYNDPFDEASDPVLPVFELYGEISLDAWFCTLQKGAGKLPYNEHTDKAEDRRTNVDLIVHPIAALNLRNPQERKMLTTSNAWAKVTWPSLQKLGIVKANEANNRWCKCKMTGTGRKYTDKNGEQREETSFEFLALYNSQAECEAAYANRHDSAGETGGSAANAEPVDPEKAGALQFAAAVVKNAKVQTGDDFGAFRNLISSKLASMPLTAKYFTVDSPEIIHLMTEQM